MCPSVCVLFWLGFLTLLLYTECGKYMLDEFIPLRDYRWKELDNTIMAYLLTYRYVSEECFIWLILLTVLYTVSLKTTPWWVHSTSKTQIERTVKVRTIQSWLTCLPTEHRSKSTNRNETRRAERMWVRICDIVTSLIKATRSNKRKKRKVTMFCFIVNTACKHHFVKKNPLQHGTWRKSQK